MNSLRIFFPFKSCSVYQNEYSTICSSLAVGLYCVSGNLRNYQAVEHLRRNTGIIQWNNWLEDHCWYTLLLHKVFLGAPFLVTNFWAYIIGSFNLGRVFLFEWTVNWRFLPEEWFVHPGFHIGLLLVHVGMLLLFGSHWFRFVLLKCLQSMTYSK